jgi:acetylornithine deacetylase/succinyl-diaminopimelate desuccinylase-like protein
MTDFSAFDAFVDAHRDQFIEELDALCRRPCISAQHIGTEETARYVANLLDGIGVVPRLSETAGAPVVYGEVGARSHTLLIYNHYDVQPPEPFEAWETRPFEPVIRSGKMYARGVSDNCADLLARVLAVRVWQQTLGSLPLRIRWLIEGEEEVGSPNLRPAVARYRDLLAADGCLWEFGDVDEDERFLIYLGVKGDYYADVVVEGPAYAWCARFLETR